MLLYTAFLLSFKHLIAVQLNTGQCGVNSLLERNSYIVGGDETSPGRWPWVCSVSFQQNAAWQHNCGGSLITYRHVLTAAHCTRDARRSGKDDQIRIRCGDFHLSNSTDDQHTQVRNVMHYDDHESYKPHLINFDITILYLDRPLRPNSYVRPICLMRSETVDTLTVLGWGMDENGQVGQELKKSIQQIFSADHCENAIGKAFWREDGFGDDIFCAADPTGSYSGSCFGDSGGPIFGFNSDQFRYELRGIVNGGKQCGRFNTPDIYTSIIYPDIYKWIREKIDCTNNQQCVPRTKCPYVDRKYRVLEDEAQTTDLKEKIKKELKSMVCDTQERLFCCPITVCGKRKRRRNSRISGGNIASPGEWPWMALLGYARKGSNNIIFECAGTLISLTNVLTSAPCLDQREVIEVRFGDTDLTTTLDCLNPSAQCDFNSDEDCLTAGQCAEKHVQREVALQAIHPQYDQNTWEYDIGIITLDRPVYITDYIIPVCLPTAPGELDNSSKNPMVVTGWGRPNNGETLHKIQVDIINRHDCSVAWGVEVFDSQVCAAGTERGSAVCAGDAGGPMVTKNGDVWEQVAVVSSGSSICGDSKPTFYTLITQEIYKWIVDNMDG